MQLLKTAFHPALSPHDIAPTSQLKITERHAARAIVTKGEDILLLYTERYHDYSLPGGGIDKGEDEVTGLIRELREETGAQNVRNVKAFARYDAYRPWHKTDADIMYMVSYCFQCEIDDELGDTAFESHEVSNGMKPVWMNIHQAIAHNEDVMATSAKKGLSIERETFLLQAIVEQLMGVGALLKTN